MNFTLNKILYNLVFAASFILLSASLSFSQNNNIIVKDSLQKSQSPDLQLNFLHYNSLVENPFYFNHLGYKYDSILLPFEFDFSINSDIENHSPTPLSFISQAYNKRMELNYALNLQRQWAEKKSLGVLGQILSYANAAAAAALLYIHLKKYDKEYGF